MKNKQLLFLMSGLLFFFLFIIFTLIVKTHRFDQFDFNTTVRIQNHTPLRFDIFFSYLSLIGSFEPLLVVLIVILLLRRKLISFLIILLFGSAHFVELIGKSIMHHPGPPHMFVRYALDMAFPSSYVQPGSSYPSGHSFRAVFLTVVFIYIIIMIKKKKMNEITKITLLCFIIGLTAVILFSRVSLGEHWTTDVIGGSLLGTSFGLFSLLFL